MGDMLFKPLGSSHLQRVQGAYITEEEIAVLVNHWRHQAEPEFREELLRRPPEPKKGEGDDDVFDPDSDDLLADAAQLVIETAAPRCRCCSAACGWATRGRAASSTCWSGGASWALGGQQAPADPGGGRRARARAGRAAARARRSAWRRRDGR